MDDDLEGDPVSDVLLEDGRDETATQRLDRNVSEILQELRVTQTGTQILTECLLAASLPAAIVAAFSMLVGVTLLWYFRPRRERRRRRHR